MALNDSSGKEERMITQIENEYFEAYSRFRSEMDMMKELNKQLPRSIKKICGKKLEKIKKKIGSKKEIEKEIGFMSAQLKKLVSEVDDEAKILFEASEEAEKLFFDLIKTASHRIKFIEFIRNMSLIYLATELESFLRSVLSLSFEYKPEILATCQKSISYEELAKYSTIEEARQDIMEKEISTLLYRDIEEVSRYFEQKFNIKLSELTEWKKFKEIFYRRNILVHNSAIVNEIYRSKTEYTGKKEILDVSYHYLNKSINLCDKFAEYLSKQLTQKFSK